jgi:hypothetical protein
MGRRLLRYTCFLIAVICLWKAVFGSGTPWDVIGFFAAGAIWYVLTWFRTRELDSPKPR